MNMSLKFKLILSYIVVAVFLVLSLLIVSNYFLNKQFQVYVLHKQDMKNQEVVDIITNSYRDDGYPPNKRFLTSLGNNLLDNGIILTLYDETGRQIFCMTDVDKHKCRNKMQRVGKEIHDNYKDFDGQYTVREFDIIKNNTKLGTVSLSYYGTIYYNEEDSNFINTFNHAFLATATLFLLLSIIMGLVIAGRIVNPIKKVTKRAATIAAGDYSGRINLKTSTIEIDELSNSIDNLAENLEEQARIKKRMANDYSHEFRTPLTTLQANLEAMIDGIWHATPERLKSLRDETLRLTRMVTDLDKLVEIQNNVSSLNKSHFDLSHLINQNLQIFAPNIEQKNITLSYNNQSCPIFADKDKIDQVIMNLISNAIKYTEQDGNISVNAYSDNGSVVFSVQDDGIGISEQDLPNVFEYMYRADQSRTRDTGGSGIGLSIVKTIVETHKGTITVQSKINEGSTFTVTLPK